MADPRPYNKQRDIIEGLTIFMRHGGFGCGAEHDEFYAEVPAGTALTTEERAALDAAGWWLSEDSETAWGIFV